MALFLTLPLELQDEIASYLMPCEVASLARVSRDTYRLFAPILYRAVPYPRNPLIVLDLLGRSALLASAVCALFIEYEVLDVARAWRESASDAQARKEEKDRRDAAAASSALQRLGSSGSRLMSLAWRSDLLVAKLSSILCAAGRFESLIELRVHPDSTKWLDWEYDFLAMPALEYLEFRQEFYDCESAVLAIGRKFGNAVDLVQSEVSKLESLHFHVGLPAAPETEDAVRIIASAINKLRLPRLREAFLYVSDGWACGADFGPFVDAHPLLSSIAFDFRGFSLKTGQLPVVKSFHGSPTDCAHILLGDRRVLEMTVWAEQGGELPTVTRDGDSWSEADDLLSFLDQNRSVESLSVIPSADRGDTVEIADDFSCLDTDHLIELVKACPQIQHLDVYVDHGPAYLLSSVFHRLSELQTIRLHYKDIIEPREEADASDGSGSTAGRIPRSRSLPYGGENDQYGDHTPRGIFPPKRYVQAIKSMSRKARKLREVSLHLRAWFGDDDDWDERDLTRDWGEPDVEINYTFYVAREGKKTHVHVVVDSERSSLGGPASTEGARHRSSF